MKEIVLASNNKGKLVELEYLLKPLQISVIPAAQFGIADIPETGNTFVENALLKARHACTITHLPAIADDSGLVIEYLNGEPGIYSARYSGSQQQDFSNNIAKVLHKLQDVPFEKRSAQFYCLLVFLRNEQDPCPIICQGTWKGFILNEPRGTQGFGYDPIFYVPTHKCSAAELNFEQKNQLSHRAQAIKKLVQELIKATVTE